MPQAYHCASSANELKRRAAPQTDNEPLETGQTLKEASGPWKEVLPCSTDSGPRTPHASLQSEVADKAAGTITLGQSKKAERKAGEVSSQFRSQGPRKLQRDSQGPMQKDKNPWLTQNLQELRPLTPLLPSFCSIHSSPQNFRSEPPGRPRHHRRCSLHEATMRVRNAPL